MADSSKTPWQNVAGRSRKVVSYVKSPLGFFSLALLIVESFLLGSGALFGLSVLVRIVAMGMGITLFLIVVGIVTMLVIKYPQALVFSEESHIEWEYLHVFGDSSRPLSAKTIVVSQGVEPPDRPIQNKSTEAQR